MFSTCLHLLAAALTHMGVNISKVVHQSLFFYVRSPSQSSCSSCRLHQQRIKAHMKRGATQTSGGGFLFSEKMLKATKHSERSRAHHWACSSTAWSTTSDTSEHHWISAICVKLVSSLIMETRSRSCVGMKMELQQHKETHL